MWYKVDFSRLAVQLLPPILRSRFLVSLLRVMTVPLRCLYGEFLSLKADADNRLVIAGNVQYLEKALNDAFYLNDRQIYIETPEERERIDYMYFSSELRDVGNMHSRAEGVPSYFVMKDEGPVPVNFIVMIPTFLCTSTDRSEDKYHGRNLKTITGILSIYKPAGRTFGIELYDYE